MPSFSLRRKVQTGLLTIGISLSLVFIPGLPVSARAPDTMIDMLSVNNVTTPTYDCRHLTTLRLPHCRGRLIWLFVSRWVKTHLQYDTTRWAMPVYLELDDADQWQRISVLCLHLTRRPR